MKELSNNLKQTIKHEIIIEFLYLDLNTCNRCQDTEKNLDDALGIFKSVADCLDYNVTVHKINVNTEELAKQYRFESSPTIRVNDNDILGEIKENSCTACSEISGVDTTCRVFSYDGETHNQPTTAMILDGILKAVFGEKKISIKKTYTLPNNLKGFYNSKIKKTGGCSCDSNRCC